MPKLNPEEIELMLDDDDNDGNFFEEPKNKHLTCRKLEVKERLDSHFEARRFREESSLEYYH